MSCGCFYITRRSLVAVLSNAHVPSSRVRVRVRLIPHDFGIEITAITISAAHAHNRDNPKSAFLPRRQVAVTWRVKHNLAFHQAGAKIVQPRSIYRAIRHLFRCQPQDNNPQGPLYVKASTFSARAFPRPINKQSTICIYT